MNQMLTDRATPQQFRPPIELSVVVPCFNEMAGLAELVRRLTSACESAVRGAYEVVFVDDGSVDGTWAEILRLTQTHPQLVGVRLARNHGHQLALTAGLSQAAGERIFIIDADLQDPPELLAEMMSHLDRGYDVAYGVRVERDGETVFKKASAALFYRILQRLSDVPIPRDAGDFRLMNRRVLDVLLRMPEQHRFVRGMIAWIGFDQIGIQYQRQARFAGRTKYPLAKMIRFALDAITGFSIAPLRFSFYLGLLSVFVAIVVVAFAIVSWIFFDTIHGWTSIAVIISFFSAMQMFCLAIMGEYLGRVYLEAKRRPLFIIREIHDVRQAAGQAMRASDRQ